MEMIRSIFITAPFLTCLFWFAVFLLHFAKGNRAQRFLCCFFATCTVLYFCHFYYFSGKVSPILEVLWTICSLSVYPLYYEYLRRLTKENSTPARLALMLLPGVLVGLSKLVITFEAADIARQILYALQMISVCWLGIRLLQAFSREISEVYADTEGKDAKGVKSLLLAFVLTSVVSCSANVLGRQFLFDKDILIFVFALIFTTLLFLLGYFGLMQTFSCEQLRVDSLPDEDRQESDSLGERLEELMTVRKFYLTHDLKVNDVAQALGTCRTYVSNHINQSCGCTFSEYINRKRIEYAKTLLMEGTSGKMSGIAHESGFSTEQSFYTNFKKYVHTSPLEWVKHNSNSSKSLKTS